MEPHAGLNNLDYIVLGIILLSGLLALMRGFLREVFSLGAWAGAYFAAAKYYPLAEPWAHRYVKNPSTATGIAAVGVFCITLIVLTIIGSLVARLVRGQALTAIDRSLGFIFGTLRGALVVCILYLVAISILWPDIDKPQTNQSPSQAVAQNHIPEQAIDKPGTDKTIDKEKEKDKDQEKPAAPDWLMQARTRPFMAYGAAVLKTFIPEKEFEKTSAQYLEKKSSAQHIIDQQTLDVLSTPTAGVSTNATTAPGYDATSRSTLDNLVNEKSKP